MTQAEIDRVCEALESLREAISLLDTRWLDHCRSDVTDAITQLWHLLPPTNYLTDKQARLAGISTPEWEAWAEREFPEERPEVWCTATPTPTNYCKPSTDLSESSECIGVQNDLPQVR